MSLFDSISSVVSSVTSAVSNVVSSVASAVSSVASNISNSAPSGSPAQSIFSTVSNVANSVSHAASTYSSHTSSGGNAFSGVQMAVSSFLDTFSGNSIDDSSYDGSSNSSQGDILSAFSNIGQAVEHALSKIASNEQNLCDFTDPLTFAIKSQENGQEVTKKLTLMHSKDYDADSKDELLDEKGLKALDTDGDGKVSMQELKNGNVKVSVSDVSLDGSEAEFSNELYNLNKYFDDLSIDLKDVQKTLSQDVTTKFNPLTNKLEAAYSVTYLDKDGRTQESTVYQTLDNISYLNSKYDFTNENSGKNANATVNDVIKQASLVMQDKVVEGVKTGSLTVQAGYGSTQDQAILINSIEELNNYVLLPSLYATDWQFASIIDNVGGGAGHSSSSVAASSQWADFETGIVAITLEDFTYNQTFYVDISNIKDKAAKSNLTDTYTAEKSAEKPVSIFASSAKLERAVLGANTKDLRETQLKLLTGTSKDSQLDYLSMNGATSQFVDDAQIKDLLNAAKVQGQAQAMTKDAMISAIFNKNKDGKSVLTITLDKRNDFGNYTQSFDVDVEQFEKGNTMLTNAESEIDITDYKNDIAQIIKDANAFNLKSSYTTISGIGQSLIEKENDGTYTLSLPDGSIYKVNEKGALISR